jgi:hypothetical protein
LHLKRNKDETFARWFNPSQGGSQVDLGWFSGGSQV